MAPRKRAAKKAEPEAAAEQAVDDVQETVDAELEQGFIGTEVDQTPNENYTLHGQVKGLPTPETDTKAQG